MCSIYVVYHIIHAVDHIISMMCCIIYLYAYYIYGISYYRYMCGVNGVFIQEEVMSIRERRFWEDRNIDMFIWTVNNHDRKSYLDSLHVPYLTDDCS